MNDGKNLTAPVDLLDLAGQINREHVQAEQSARTALTHALKAGELLLTAKAQVGHGAWLDWLRDNCKVSGRTAQAYMRLARELPKLDDSKAQRVADMPLRQALAALTEKDEDVKPVRSELAEARALARREERLRARLIVTEKLLDAASRDGDMETLAAIARDTWPESEAAEIRLRAERGLGRCLIELKAKLPGVSERELLDSINSGAFRQACDERIRELTAQGPTP